MTQKTQKAFDPTRFSTDPIIPLDAPFEDERGAIHPLVNAVMESALLITSKAGTVRANHYHKQGWHYCYVLEGEIEYYYRPNGSTADPARVVIKKGQLFFTPPLVDHAMKFTQDTVFLTLGGSPRDQGSYEADVERIELIQP